MMTIDLEQRTEAELIRRAQEEGKRPEQYAAELLRSSLHASADQASVADDGTYSDERGWLRDRKGNLLGFDRMTWRELAHDGHKI